MTLGLKRKTANADAKSLCMKIIFWNVNRKDLSEYIQAMMVDTGADAIVLNESVVGSEETLRMLRDKVSPDFASPVSISDVRFKCFVKSYTLGMSELIDGNRFSVRELTSYSQKTLLVLVHGVDMINYDADNRRSHMQVMSSELAYARNQYGTNRMILIGDFNLNPFDSAMNVAAGLNAMMTRNCVKRGVRMVQKAQYDYFYNPMWSLFGDQSAGPAGTIYNTSSRGHFGWNMLDQVLVSSSALRCFSNVKILDKAGDMPLTQRDGRPAARKASDHLPILLELNGDPNV